MSKTPVISIVLPTYNRIDSLRVAIDSVLHQSYEDFQLIVVNDASSDGTRAFLDSDIKDKRVVLIHNPQNLGLQKSLNKGLEAASGEFIARIDDDDRWIDSDKLKKQLDYMRQNTDCILLGTAYQDESGQVTHNPLSDGELRKQMLFRCPFRHSSILFRASGEEWRYDEQLKYSEDWELWLRMGQKGSLANLDDVTVEIATENNATQKFFTKQIPINIELIKKHRSNYPNSAKALLYHKFLLLFFKVVPLDGIIHRFFQKVFSLVFLKSKSS